MDKGTQGRIDLAADMLEKSRNLVSAVGHRVEVFINAYKFRNRIERMTDGGYVGMNVDLDSDGDLLSRIIQAEGGEVVSDRLRLLWLERVERALADLRQEAHDLWMTLDCAAMGVDKPTVKYNPATGAIVDTTPMGGTASERMKQPEAETVAAETEAKTMGKILGDVPDPDFREFGEADGGWLARRIELHSEIVSLKAHIKHKLPIPDELWGTIFDLIDGHKAASE